MKINRRGLIKSVFAAGGSAALARPGKAAAGVEHFTGNPDRYGCLTDLTRCVGCRSCEAACNEANGLPKPEVPFDDDSVFEHERRTSEKAYTVVNRYDNVRTDAKPVFRKIQCNHCNEPSCASACLVNAYTKTPEGAVLWNKDLCLGCRMCMLACPFYIPTFEYDKPVPKIQKCNMCHDRTSQGKMPACVEACPMEAIAFGKRSELIKLARERIEKEPDRYIDHIYGEHEVGGTSWMYISGVPFERVGFDEHLGVVPFPQYTRGFLSAVPLVLVIWPALLGGFYLFSERREELDDREKSGKPGERA